MWQKYCWRDSEKIIGLYNNHEENIFFEFKIAGRKVEKLLFYSGEQWDKKWQIYFREKDMLGIFEMLEIDKILWPNK